MIVFQTIDDWSTRIPRARAQAIAATMQRGGVYLPRENTIGVGDDGAVA